MHTYPVAFERRMRFPFSAVTTIHTIPRSQHLFWYIYNISYIYYWFVMGRRGAYVLYSTQLISVQVRPAATGNTRTGTVKANRAWLSYDLRMTELTFHCLAQPECQDKFRKIDASLPCQLCGWIRANFATKVKKSQSWSAALHCIYSCRAALWFRTEVQR